MSRYFRFIAELFILWAYIAVMYGVIKLIKVKSRYILIIFYLWMIPIMLTGIFMGTFGDPRQISVTIMVFLCVVPMFILDKPWRIGLFIILTAIAYVICCYLAKPLQVFYTDMVDLVLVSGLGIGANFFILRDRIDNVEKNMELMHMAETDFLTDLHNRGAGVEKVESLLRQGRNGMFILMDCDNFKYVNDHYGHGNGDTSLKNIAVCIQKSFRDDDICMRIGGDEYAVFVQNLNSTEDAGKCIERMMKRINNVTISEMPGYHLTVSVGVSVIDSEHRKTFEMLYKESDEALYQSKSRGKNICTFYGEKDQ